LSICTADGIQGDPDVAFDGANYMVIWSDLRFAGNNAVYGTRVTPGGVILDPAGIQIGPVNGTYQKEPSIIFIDDKYFVVWGHLTSPYGITGRFVNTDGTLGDTVHIATPGDVVHSTDIAYDGNKMFVVWAEYPGLLRGQFVSTSGTLIGSPFTIADDVLVVNAGGICFSGSEYFVIYSRWEGSVLELWGRKYDASGNPLGSPFRIANPAHSSTDGYVIAGDEHYLCLWSKLLYPADIYGNLDVEVGIEDNQTRPVEQDSRYTSTITSGPLVLPDDKEFKVFDIMGREVRAANPAPGIYFIELEGEVVQKIIKVR
jgi:hypothetical protein